MRIGLDATSLPASLAGAGRYMRGLITGLAAIDAGHEYTVFVKAIDRPRFAAISQPHITFVSVPCAYRPGRLYWEVFTAPEVIRAYHLDVWHAPHYIIPWGTGSCKAVVTFHDMVFHLFPEFCSVAKRLTFRRAMAHAVRTADGIIATSQATSHEAQRLLHASPERIHVIHPGIDEGFRPVRHPGRLAAVRRRYGLGAPYILAVGTMDRRKNLNLLIEAYHRLIITRQTDCALIIAGQPGDGYAGLLETIRSRQLQNRVHLLHYVDEDDLPALYSGAALFVSTSRYEGYGFPALEALSCGAPVLSSPSPSILETTSRSTLVADALSVEVWCDRMVNALASTTPGGALLANPEKYAWTRVAEQTVQVYEAIGSSARPVSVPAMRPSNGVPALIPDACSLAVLKTIVYGDLFEYPLSLAEIHRNLIGYMAPVEEVAAALKSAVLSDFVIESQHLYMLRDRQGLVAERRRRALNAARLLDRHRRLLYWLCACPFVRMTAISGALAFHNGEEDGDIDLFLVVEKGRLWATYAFLACVAKLTGKRDLLCLNYLIGRSDFTAAERDFFTAHQIANLRPVYGWAHYRRFTLANLWVMDCLPQWDGHAPGTHAFPEIRLNRLTRWIKRLIEWAGSLPLFHPVEWLIHALYSGHIKRKLAHRSGHTVRLSRDEIKLHTNDHNRRIMDWFDRRLAETMKQDARLSPMLQDAHAWHHSNRQTP